MRNPKVIWVGETNFFPFPSSCLVLFDWVGGNFWIGDSMRALWVNIYGQLFFIWSKSLFIYFAASIVWVWILLTSWRKSTKWYTHVRRRVCPHLHKSWNIELYSPWVITCTFFVLVYCHIQSYSDRNKDAWYEVIK